MMHSLTERCACYGIGKDDHVYALYIGGDIMVMRNFGMDSLILCVRPIVGEKLTKRKCCLVCFAWFFYEIDIAHKV